MKMAKLGIAIERFMKDTHCTVSAVQCWTSLEENFGVVPCTVMSMMSESLLPAACETDVMGTVSMHALALASQTPSALLDWNNNYGDDENKCVCFHCSNLPKHFFPGRGDELPGDHCRDGGQGEHVWHLLWAGEGGRDELRALLDRRLSRQDSRVRRARASSRTIRWRHLAGAGVAKIPQLQKLLHEICEQGFEHHVAANFSQVAAPVYEAATRYLGWEMHWHEQRQPVAGSR